MVCTLLWWIVANDFPTSVVAVPYVDTFNATLENNEQIPVMVAELIFLYLLYLNGIVSTLGKVAALTREDETLPRGEEKSERETLLLLHASHPFFSLFLRVLVQVGGCL